MRVIIAQGELLHPWVKLENNGTLLYMIPSLVWDYCMYAQMFPSPEPPR